MEREYNIPPKPQCYNGILFRVTIEARWAIFFDCLGIEYEYEPQCEEVETGCRSIFYKPDFYLPALNKYVEIKPSKPYEAEKFKASAWSKDISEIVVLFSLNPPTDDKENGWCFISERANEPPNLFKGYSWGECPKCGHIDIADYGQILSCGCYTLDQLNKMYEEEERTDRRIIPNFERSKRLLTAYRIANNYKFKQGNNKKVEKLLQFQQSLF